MGDHQAVQVDDRGQSATQWMVLFPSYLRDI
jgi:hypothetical protein